MILTVEAQTFSEMREKIADLACGFGVVSASFPALASVSQMTRGDNKHYVNQDANQDTTPKSEAIDSTKDVEPTLAAPESQVEHQGEHPLQPASDKPRRGRRPKASPVDGQVANPPQASVPAEALKTSAPPVSAPQVPPSPHQAPPFHSVPSPSMVKVAGTLKVPVDMDAALNALKEVTEKKGIPEGKKVLAAINCARWSEVKPEQYTALVEACTRALSS